MTSFVNLMSNDLWSEADIKVRLHAEIRSEFSEPAEAELNRALQGSALGLHTLTGAEMLALQHFKSLTDRVTNLGLQARNDASLLANVLALEACVMRLSRSAVELAVDSSNIAEYTADKSERDETKLAVDSVDKATSDLYQLRNPPTRQEGEIA